MKILLDERETAQTAAQDLANRLGPSWKARAPYVRGGNYVVSAWRKHTWSSTVLGPITVWVTAELPKGQSDPVYSARVSDRNGFISSSAKGLPEASIDAALSKLCDDALNQAKRYAQLHEELPINKGDLP